MNPADSQSEIRSLSLGRRLSRGLVAGLSSGVLAFALGFTPLFEGYEARTLDLRQRLLARPTAAAEQVALLTIDDSSIEEARRPDKERLTWPWPRDVYEPIVLFLKEAGAKAVVFDLLFVDPSRLSHEDAVFAAAAKSSGIVSLACKLSADPGAKEAEAAALERARVDLPDWPFAQEREFKGLNAPVPELAAASRVVGFINVVQDGDGVVRRADLVYPLSEAPGRSQVVASLPLAAARAALGDEGALELEGRTLHFAGGSVPLGPDGRALVRFYGPEGTLRTRNALSVLRSFAAAQEGTALSVDPGDFKDRVVFVGVHIAGMEDIVSAPMGPRFSGTEFLATVCANLLGGEFLSELGAPVRLGFLAALGAGSGLLCFFLWQPARVLAAAVLVFAAQVLVSVAAYRQGLLLQVFLPALAITGSCVATLLFGYLSEGRRKREVAQAFSQYLSPVVVRDLLKEPDKLRLGGETREITVFFSDLQGFSSFSEGMTPQELVAFLNEYLTLMTDTILEHRGVIDKYEGDAIMAFWGAPLADERQAEAACLAAIEQGKALGGLNERFRAQGRPLLKFRAGLHTGPAVVGNMGSTRRFAYTAMGDTVNLASRLEGANKAFGTSVLVSGAVRAAVGESIVSRRLGRVRVVGRAAAVEVHELVGLRAEIGEADLRRLERYHEALRLLESGSCAEASLAFGALLSEAHDPVVERLARKCEDLVRAQGAWDGIWVLESKG
jgi:adenylate cyclase